MKSHGLLGIWVAALAMFVVSTFGIPPKPTYALVDNLDVTTQHNDSQRTGANLNETILTTANVGQNTFGKLFSLSVDGQIYAQPLYLSNRNIGGKARNVVYVATMHNTVYGFDADDPSAPVLWSKNLGPSVALPDSNIGPSGYTDITVEVGILSTPVIDKANGLIYVLAMTKENNEYIYRLHALDLNDGSEKLNGPVKISASVTNSNGDVVKFENTKQAIRPALTLANGRIYIGSASFGALHPYYGWVLGYNATTLAREVAFNVSPDADMGGIWQAGQGFVKDPDGNIYFQTGAGPATWMNGGRDYGDTVMKMSGTSGAILDWFTPSNHQFLSDNNWDLSAGGSMLIPGTKTLITGGKEGKIFVLNTDNLGKLQQAVSQVQVVNTGGHIFGTPVYWEGPSGKRIYVWAGNTNMKAYDFNGSQLSNSPVSQGLLTLTTFMPGGILSISADGNKAGTGIVWVNMPETNSNPNRMTVGGVLRAFDANDLTRELWNSDNDADRLGDYAKFAPPTVVNGKVFMATFSGRLVVYGPKTVTANPTSAKLEAENAALVLTEKETNHGGYSGTGFVGRYVTANVGASTTFNVVPGAAGSAAVTLRYSNGSGSSKTLSLILNGVKIKQVTLLPTANWDTWADQTENLQLLDGFNSVAYKYEAGDTANVNLDYINVSSQGTPPTNPPNPPNPPTTTPTKLEAESAALVLTQQENNHPGYSGTGFVGRYITANVGASTTFSVVPAAAGAANVTLRYSNGTGSAKTLSLYLNGVKIKQTTLAATANWDTWANQTETLQLAAGTNTIAYKYDSGDTANVNLDYIGIDVGTTTPPTTPPTNPPTNPPTTPAKLEAENAALVLTEKESNHGGYSGTGFIGRYITANVGASTTFSVVPSAAGAANVTLRYSNATGSSKTLSLYLNGVKVKQTTLAATANWDTWANQAETLTLVAGTNTIAYKYDAGDTANVNLDYISIDVGTTTPPTPPTPTPTKLEAENAGLVLTQVESNHAGYSGTGFVGRYVTANVGASTTFTVVPANAGTAAVTLRYSNGNGSARTLSLYVNGVKIKQTTLAATANWQTWANQTETITLAAGTNTIAYKYDSGDTANVNLDYISVAGN